MLEFSFSFLVFNCTVVWIKNLILHFVCIINRDYSLLCEEIDRLQIDWYLKVLTYVEVFVLIPVGYPLAFYYIFSNLT